ncbi:adenylyl-sulfate kinase [Sphingobacterium siyangense]|jgi:adenylylsulfate kinase|uniref:adenylyl-sulfate kinase n=1 Tax=Sphingobacterium siyangense TaxID=459529 RepID=UPI0028B11AD0|nr:adenylyl-sulfate kinase [Sphingobacterium siyangense]
MKGFIVWFSGLSGSGKTTLATRLYNVLKDNHKVICLDGDILRTGLNADLGFDLDDRSENIRRAAEVAKILMKEDYIVLASFITPIEDLRIMVRNIIGKANLMEVFLSAPIEICVQRDPKGLYALAEQGKIPPMTGKGSAFETPEQVDITIDTSSYSIEECIAIITAALRKKGVTSSIKRSRRFNREMSIFKAVSWRLLGTIGTIMIAWYVSGKWNFAVQIGLFELFFKIGLFYVHDRIWEKVSRK